ncbi:hypothetical protein PPSQR21_032430 [Paenibacillus polymyxa SQR-21]|uniref:hypothetical protein n=1 Tax=Paenibacillus polymyxa TaxID=1406 RepID=UPI00042E3132|nr:hypothetical protein [Paenibacillus polymyxa]AHM66882.1 hypothetical protein PPSQR21_032430 [Paenibacillus polymyxa SQR-21]
MINELIRVAVEEAANNGYQRGYDAGYAVGYAAALRSVYGKEVGEDDVDGSVSTARPAR